METPALDTPISVLPVEPNLPVEDPEKQARVEELKRALDANGMSAVIDRLVEKGFDPRTLTAYLSEGAVGNSYSGILNTTPEEYLKSHQEFWHRTLHEWWKELARIDSGQKTSVGDFSEEDCKQGCNYANAQEARFGIALADLRDGLPEKAQEVIGPQDFYLDLLDKSITDLETRKRPYTPDVNEKDRVSAEMALTWGFDYLLEKQLLKKLATVKTTAG